MAKSMYKDLVSVKRNEETGEIYVTSKVYSITNSPDLEIFYNEHFQNFCYLVVDPVNRHVNVWYHKWVSHW
jgi:hypothetical protein